MKKIYRFLAVLIVGGAGAAVAQDARLLDEVQVAQYRAWAQSPEIVAAVQAQNKETTEYSERAILALDKIWRGEVILNGGPIMSPVMDSPVSDFLRAEVAESHGILSEIILMDAKGLNVGASSPTSDFWQGDESKHSETYPKGFYAVHYSEVEFDSSTQSYQQQVSFVVADPLTQTPIGAMTLGVYRR